MRRNPNATLAGSSISRAGRPREHVNPKEEHRARQQRYRDKKKAKKHQAMADAYRERVACEKCRTANGGTCESCAYMTNKLLNDMGLRINRGAYFARKELVSGGYDATKTDAVVTAAVRGRHGRGVSIGHDRGGNLVKQGRYTDRVGTKDVMQVWTEKRLDMRARHTPQDALRQCYLDRLRWTVEYFEQVRQHPNATKDELLELAADSPVGRAMWKRFQAGETH